MRMESGAAAVNWSFDTSVKVLGIQLLPIEINLFVVKVRDKEYSGDTETNFICNDVGKLMVSL